MSREATPPALADPCVCADSRPGRSRDTDWKEVMSFFLPLWWFCVWALPVQVVGGALTPVSSLSSTNGLTKATGGICSIPTSASSLLCTKTLRASSTRRPSSRPFPGSSGASTTRDPASPSDPCPRGSCPARAMTPCLPSLTWTDNLPPSRGVPGSPAGAEPMSGGGSSDRTRGLEDYSERDRKSHPSSCRLSLQPVRVKEGYSIVKRFIIKLPSEKNHNIYTHIHLPAGQVPPVVCLIKEHSKSSSSAHSFMAPDPRPATEAGKTATSQSGDRSLTAPAAR